MTQASVLGSKGAVLRASVGGRPPVPVAVLAPGQGAVGATVLLDLNFFDADGAVTFTVDGAGPVFLAGTVACFADLDDEEEGEGEEGKGAYRGMRGDGACTAPRFSLTPYPSPSYRGRGRGGGGGGER